MAPGNSSTETSAILREQPCIRLGQVGSFAGKECKIIVTVSFPPYARRYLIHFEPFGWSVAVSPGTTLLDAAQLAGLRLPSTCRGQGDCCECKVVVLAGEVTSPSDLEETCIEAGTLDQSGRLACCTRILGGVRVHIPGDSGLRP